MRIVCPHMGRCSVVQDHGIWRLRRWDPVRHKGGGRGGTLNRPLGGGGDGSTSHVTNSLFCSGRKRGTKALAGR